MYRHVLSTLLIVALFGLTGCFHSGVQPRTADLLRAGKGGGAINYTPYGYASGTFTHEGGVTTEGNSAQRGMMTPFGWVLMAFPNMVMGGRMGVASWLELSGHIGFQEIGAGIRVGILDEDRGDSLSLAAATSVAWRPHTSEDRPWASAGVDLSHRSSGITPFGNLYLSYGPETHAMLLDDVDDAETCDIIDCGIYGFRHLLIDNQELRLQLAGGIALPIEEGYFKLSMAFYSVLDAQTEDMLCVSCGELDPIGFEETWGMNFVLGVEFGKYKEGWEPTLDPNDPNPTPFQRVAPVSTPEPEPEPRGTGDGRLHPEEPPPAEQP